MGIADVGGAVGGVEIEGGAGSQIERLASLSAGFVGAVGITKAGTMARAIRHQSHHAVSGAVFTRVAKFIVVGICGELIGAAFTGELLIGAVTRRRAINVTGRQTRAVRAGFRRK